MSKQLNPQERRLLASDIVRGRLTSEFIKGEFWAEVLGPYLQAEEEDCAEKCVPKPAQGLTIEAIALQGIFNAGMKGQCHKIREDFAIWIEKGKTAKLKLDETLRRVSQK